MVDWQNVFDESHPESGATDSEIEELIQGLSVPLSASEEAELSDSIAVNPASWRIPDYPLPELYINLLRWSNGGEFRTGERWFQFFSASDPSHGIRAMMLAYHIPLYMEGSIPFAFNGAGTFYLFDMRETPVDGEYPTIAAPAGCLTYDEECVSVASCFLDACSGSVSVESLRKHGR